MCVCSRMMIQIQKENCVLMHFPADKRNHQTHKLRATKQTSQLAFHTLIWSPTPSSCLVAFLTWTFATHMCSYRPAHSLLTPSHYPANGLIPKAVDLVERVIKIGETTLSEDHPDRLSSQHELYPCLSSKQPDPLARNHQDRDFKPLVALVIATLDFQGPPIARIAKRAPHQADEL